MTDAPEGTLPTSLQGRWHTYTPADGLAALHVEHVAEDREGCLWIATCSGGVSRYDGGPFRTYTARDGLASNLLYVLLCDRRGRVWLGTADRGLCWFEDGTFHVFAAHEWYARDSVLWLFEDSRGRIWFAGYCGVGYVEDGAVRDLSAPYRSACGHRPVGCWGIAEDENGDMWFGGLDVSRWDGRQFVVLGPDHGLCPPQELYYAVTQGPDGAVWVGRGQHLYRGDHRGFAAVRVELSGTIRKLQLVSDGRLWLSTVGGAVYLEGGAFHAIGAADGLGHARVNCVCHDHEGQYWFATWGGGLSCLDPDGPHRSVGAVGATGATAHSLAAARDAVWWGGLDGRVEPGGAQSQALVGRSDGSMVRAADWPRVTYTHFPPVLAADGSGGLWIGLTEGLFRYDGHSCQRMYPVDDEGPSPVTALATDHAGRLYFGCERHSDGQVHCRRSERYQREIVVFDGHGFRVLHREPVASCLRALLPRDDGSLWLALGVTDALGAGEGAVCLGPDGVLQRWTAADGLADNRAMDLAADARGHLWLATMAGLSRYDGHGFRTFTRSDGLPTDHLLCLCFDRRGRLWIGTEGALVVFGDGAFQYQWLDEAGCINDIVEDQDEEEGLWLATDRGLWRYRAQSCRPRVRISRVLADRAYDAPQEVRVAASVPQLEVEYQGASLRTPAAAMTYRYRLQGWEEEWRQSVRAPLARYPRLPVGNYVFEVQAVDRDLNHSEAASVRVVVEPDPQLEGLSRALSGNGNAGEFVGDSPALRRVLAQLRGVAPTEVAVLILGETGTGKGLAARTLHQLSRRQGGPFVTVSCGAVPETLVESELFGHERGAFTGAHRRQLGKVELARGGTLFLDEVGDLPLAAQSKLLRLLEEGTFERVGGQEQLRCQARIVAATNRDLSRMVKTGEFRQDLYYRLEVFVLRLPALRDRREDVESLTLYFLERMAAHLHRTEIQGLSPQALELLRSHEWPGNVRELENVVRRGVIVGRSPVLGPEDLGLGPVGPGQPAAAGPPAPLGPGSDGLVSLAENERRHIQHVLARTNGVIKGPQGAAAVLGVPGSTLYSRMKKLGIA